MYYFLYNSPIFIKICHINYEVTMDLALKLFTRYSLRLNTAREKAPPQRYIHVTPSITSHPIANLKFVADV